MGQQCFMLCSTLFYLCCQPCIIYNFSFCRWVSSWIAAHVSFKYVCNDIFTDLLMTLTFTFIPVISWPLISVWLFWDSQSAINMFGPGLYTVQTLYWCICSILCCNSGHSVATSLLSIVTNGSWSLMTHSSQAKQYSGTSTQ